MLNDLAEQYFHEKNVDKRRAMLKTSFSSANLVQKSFLRKHLKKSENWI